MRPWGPDPDVVVAEVKGICGGSCGESVRWVMFLEPRVVWDRGTEPESWLVVLRDQPMYAEAVVRGADGREVARCGERFTYNGTVTQLTNKEAGQ